MTENSIQILPIDKVKINPKNPRTITDEAFKKLVKSIKDFPDMLNKRPIIVNDKMIILGGNKRYEAAVEAGLKEIPVIITDWNKRQQEEFLIKDNISFGEWNTRDLSVNYDLDSLIDWGLDSHVFALDNLEDFFNTSDKTAKKEINKITFEYDDATLFKKVTTQLEALGDNKEEVLLTLLKIKK